MGEIEKFESCEFSCSMSRRFDFLAGWMTADI